MGEPLFDMDYRLQKTHKARGRNRQFERWEKARENGVKSRLAVYGCQKAKIVDSQ